MKNSTIGEVLSKIESQSEFFFLYSPKIVNVKKEVSIDVREKQIYDILDQLFKETNINYLVFGRQIVLALKDLQSAGTSQGSFEEFLARAASQPQPGVKGVITDAQTGQPMPGVNIVIEGTTIGTISNLNGEYSLPQVSRENVLVYSFVGYVTQRVAVGDQTIIDISLAEAVRELDEVVVVGYGTQRKVTLTGSIANISGDEVAISPATNLSSSLAGRLPGLFVMNPSGEPGNNAATLRIRGENTLGNNSPLIVVDGVAGRSMNQINASDIESITVLKDASAAIYGSQAANGVILITTKRGGEGAPKITVNMNAGFNQPTRVPEMSNAFEYATMLNENAYYITPALGKYQQYSEEELQKFKDGSDPWNYPDTDWIAETMKKYSAHNSQNVSISGGTERTRYFVSLNAKYEDAYYKNSINNYKQYDFRSNIDGKVSDHISVSLDVSGRQEDRTFGVRDLYITFASMLQAKPTRHARWPSGEPGPPVFYGDNPVVITTNQAGYNNQKRYVLETRGNVRIDIPWVKGLSIQGNASYDKTIRSDKEWETPWYLYNWDGNPEYTLTRAQFGLTAPQLTRSMSDYYRTTINALARYETTILGNHNVSVLAGTERQSSYFENLRAFRRNFLSTELDQLFAGAKDDFLDNDGSASQTARGNYFGRVNYNFSDKYLLEFVWRYDGSYIFPKGKQFGFFPGISAGYRISEEEFWRNNVGLIDNLKLRASWGKTGNDRINEYQYLSSYGFRSSTLFFARDGGLEGPLLYELRIPNTDITWEVATQSNVGFDMLLLRNRLSVSADYFYNYRSQILWWRNASVPATSGLSLPRENIGEVSNQGFEAVIGYRDRLGDFRYNISVNGSYAKNKIEFWDETPGVPDYQVSTGMPMNSQLMYEAIGIFKDQAQIDATPSWTGARPGDIIFRDVNGDSIINGLDRVRQDKTGLPRITGGININLQFKQFDLTALFQGSLGGANYLRYESGETGNYLKEFYDGRWTEENTDATHPRAWERDQPYWSTSNTFFYKSTDYLRLKTLEVGYNLPVSRLDFLNVELLRLYVNGFNLFTIDKYKWRDPELLHSKGPGYPTQRIVTAGVALTF